MTQAKRTSARAVLLAAGAAGFVALGAGVSTADTMPTPMHEVAPTVERALVEGVAPTMHSLAPGGVGPIANSALTELQESATPAKPAPDLAAPLPDGRPVATPLGEVPNPTGDLADAVGRTQSGTGLDGVTQETVGHRAGDAVERTSQEAGAVLGSMTEGTGTSMGESTEEAGSVVDAMGHGTGASVEETANDLLPHTVEATKALPSELELDQATGAVRLPDTAEAPGLDGLTDLTGDNSLALSDTADLGNALAPLGSTSQVVPQSAGKPVTPNMWDLAHVFGVETPDRVQDVVESNRLTDDNYVDVGIDDALGMVGNRNLEDGQTLPQAAPSAPATPGVADLTGALGEGLGSLDTAEPVGLDGPLAGTELPRVAEGAEAETAEDLVSGLSQGTDLLSQIDTSDLVSVEGGSPEQPPAEGVTHHPTFTELPGSEALPVVS
ncbi:hypothetical protein [Nocardiopsis sp. NRRL B-16309]|uniref:hypothetical protein n=1 Tax=Nocardiopsis sp. NRRL B-16309 TaxID=1519494 RepID=UPI0006AEB5DD|nr:hypothetical protein [Nocardiopsis sp. NRRL B-16309]KOX16475.1 hypothetical protein ADL05_12200 [Nocardiopsis sp. NRRL B-16309]